MLKCIQKTLFVKDERECLKSLIHQEYIRLFKELPENFDFLLINCNDISSKMVCSYHNIFDRMTIGSVIKDNIKHKTLDCCLNFFDRTFLSDNYYKLFMNENFILENIFSIRYKYGQDFPIFYNRIWNNKDNKEQILLIIRKSNLDDIYSEFGVISFLMKSNHKLRIEMNDYHEERIIELDDNLSKYYFDKLMKEENKNV